MKIRRIELDDNGTPDVVTVEMSRQEAVFIARVMGHMNGTQSNAVMKGGDALGSEIYSCLSGDLFNRFWEDGIEGAGS